MCAVAFSEVKALAARLPGRPAVLSLTPPNLSGIFDDLLAVAAAARTLRGPRRPTTAPAGGPRPSAWANRPPHRAGSHTRARRQPGNRPGRGRRRFRWRTAAATRCAWRVSLLSIGAVVRNKKRPAGRDGRALRKSASAGLLDPRRLTNSPVEAGVLTFERCSRVAEAFIHSCGTVPDFTGRRDGQRSGSVTGLHLYALASGLAGRLNTVQLVRMQAIVVRQAIKVKRPKLVLAQQP